MFKSASIFTLGLALLPYVSAAVHDIKVGAGGLLFEPEAIVSSSPDFTRSAHFNTPLYYKAAQPGDQVVFHFVAKNHTVRLLWYLRNT